MFKTVDTQATSGIRWKTVGFIITREACLSGEKRNGGYPLKLSHGIIMLKDDWITRSEYDGIVKMTFTIPKEVVSAALVKAGMDELKNDDILYLHGIFQVTHNGVNYGNRKYDLPSIVNAENWANPDDFEDRFDVKVLYKAPEEPIGVQYKTAAGEVMDTETFARSNWVQPGSTVSISLDMEKEYQGKLYKLYKSYARYYELQTAIPGTGLSTMNGIALSQVANRKINQRVGGVQFVGIMKEVKQTDPEEENSYRVSQKEIIPYGEIEADNRGAPSFHVEEGIPSSEKVYCNVFTKEYLLEYEFEKVLGKKNYEITITKTYELVWNEWDEQQENLIEMQESKTVEKKITVTRAYSYWKLVKAEYDIIKDAIVENQALPEGKILLEPNGYSPPEAVYYLYSKEEHLKEPSYKKYITLATETIQGADSCPSIPDENFQSYGEEKIGDVKARNDVFMVGNMIAADGVWKDKETNEPAEIESASVVGENVLFQSGITIPAQMLNGIYETKGLVEYKPVLLYPSVSDSNLSYSIEKMSSVIVHTPVVCEPDIEDAKKYCQLLNPDKSRAALVLDRSFRITIPVVGEHLFLEGYGYRDYGKYIRTRQIRIPFDVYADKEFVPANSWFTFCQDSQVFYIPVWVKEGNYTLNCRTVALNALEEGTFSEEEYANLNRANDTAIAQINVQVSGRLYGMKIMDISDYPNWYPVFRQEESGEISLRRSNVFYYSGLENQNGEQIGIKPQFTFPLIPGSHPSDSSLGILHTGYASRFVITTVGEMSQENDYIQVEPAFYWMDQNGQNRKPVDVYYKETVNGMQNILVEIGSDIDLANIKYQRLGDPYFAVDEQELSEKASLEGETVEEIIYKSSSMFTFHHILLSDSFRTYKGISFVPEGVIPKTVSKENTSKSVQTWYGEYYLPSHLYVTEKGFDLAEYEKENGGFTFRESLFLQSGYLLVHFNITSIQAEKPYLSYGNEENASQGYCNMWNMECYQKSKVDSYGTCFSFEEGDYLLYDLSSRASMDYVSSGTH